MNNEGRWDTNLVRHLLVHYVAPLDCRSVRALNWAYYDACAETMWKQRKRTVRSLLSLRPPPQQLAVFHATNAICANLFDGKLTGYGPAFVEYRNFVRRSEWDTPLCELDCENDRALLWMHESARIDAAKLEGDRLIVHVSFFINLVAKRRWRDGDPILAQRRY
jgi:hypothetical protein